MAENSASGVPDLILDFTDGGELAPALLRHLDQIAEAQRNAFNALIAELTSGREYNIDWWVSRPASRNTHSSKLFTQCIQVALVRALLDEGVRPLVKTDSPEITAILKPALGADRVILRGGTWRRRLRSAIWNACSALFHALASRWAAHRTQGKIGAPVAGPLSVLEVFVYRDSFTSGTFKDFHYPSLYESLSEEQRRRFCYMPLFYRVRNYTALFRDMRRSDRNYLVREDYLHWSDYAFAFGHWWRAGQLMGRQVRFAGFDVGPLVDADLRAGRFANSAIQALLGYRFWRLRASGLNIDRYIDWYEGHDLDHAVAAAINWHAHAPDLVALRPIAPKSYLSVTPARHEIACGAAAFTWGVIGGSVRDEMAHANPELCVLPAPGLRHLRLRQFERRTVSGERPAVLVLLSQEMELTTRLLTTVAPLLRADNAYRWLVKRHPGMPKEEAEAAIAAQVTGIELVEGDLYDWLTLAAVVVGLGSNTLIEAAAGGVPVICASSGNEPTEVPFSGSLEPCWWSVCYDSEELAALIPQAIASAGDTQMSDARKEALLGPFDVEAMRVLLFAPLPAGASLS